MLSLRGICNSHHLVPLNLRNQILRATLNTPLTYASISDKNKDKLVRESSRNIENRDIDEKTEN